MATTRMTSSMHRSLQARLEDLNKRIATIEAQRDGDDSVEAIALLMQLGAERTQIDDALRHATLIDDEPFDFEAIEVGDAVTIQDDEGESERYVLVDEGVGPRVRSDWVSVSSPLGSAILGRNIGDRVEVESPSGPTTYVILGFERAAETSLVLPYPDRRDDIELGLPSESFLG